MNRTVHIIGAGPGGLATAILLAARGAKVKIFERLPVIGGRTSCIESDGYRFDLGPTFYLYPRILEEIFASVGVDFRAEVEMRRLDPQYRIEFGAGGRLDATPNVEEMERQIGELSRQDAPGFRRFLQENRDKLNAVKPCLERPFLNWRALFSTAIAKAWKWVRPWESMDTYLRRFFRDPRVRLAFSFQSKYLGMSPFRCPSLFSILSFLEYEYGVWHPVGGCSAVMEGMARVARRFGVEICLDEPVEEILFAGRKAIGLRTRTGNHHADAVVVNADFARSMHKLVPDRLRKRWTNRKLAAKKFSCSTFMLYLGMEGQYDLPHHTIYVAKEYEKNLADIEQRKVLSEDPSFYVQNAGVTDSTLAPRGHSTLYVLVPVPHQTAGIDWKVEREAMRAKALKQIEKVGFTGVEKRIRFERCITPADWDTRYDIHLGATFNLAHSMSQMLHLRPRNRFEDLDGIYLVGGGTHPGSGLPVIFESARITSRLLGQDLNLPEPRPAAARGCVDDAFDSANHTP